MRASQHTTRGPFRLLECRHGLADIVERGVAALAKRPPVIRPHTETEIITRKAEIPDRGQESQREPDSGIHRD